MLETEDDISSAISSACWYAVIKSWGEGEGFLLDKLLGRGGVKELSREMMGRLDERGSGY